MLEMFRFSREQIEKFVAASDRDLVNRIRTFMESETPDLIAEVPQADRNNQIAGTIPRAKRIGVESDLGFAYFAILSQLMGDKFEHEPEISIYLSCREIEMEELLDNLFSEIVRNIETELR